MKWIKVSERLPDSQGYYFVKTGRNRKEIYSWKNEEHSANTWEYEVTEWLDESPTKIGQQGEWQPDKKNIYISPSGEQLRIYRDGEWKQYIRADVFASQPTPPQEGQDELWEELVRLVEEHHFRQTKYPEVYEKLKSKYKLIKL